MVFLIDFELFFRQPRELGLRPSLMLVFLKVFFQMNNIRDFLTKKGKTALQRTICYIHLTMNSMLFLNFDRVCDYLVKKVFF